MDARTSNHPVDRAFYQMNAQIPRSQWPHKSLQRNRGVAEIALAPMDESKPCCGGRGGKWVAKNNSTGSKRWEQCKVCIGSDLVG